MHNSNHVLQVYFLSTTLAVAIALSH